MSNLPTTTEPMWLQGDVLGRLADIPDDTVQCVVTSPPYWSLRDYGVDGQIGLEPTLQGWLDKMVDVMRGVRRVLRPDGTVWLNIGDAYARDGGWSNNAGLDGVPRSESGRAKTYNNKCPDAMKPKDLLLMPARLAIALQADGWWLRSAIVWAKPNPMPESVTDRPTSSYEMVYLLTKAARYYYDADAVREDNKDTYYGQRGGIVERKKLQSKMRQVSTSKEQMDKYASCGRNSRNVWHIATHARPEAHFATFPPELVRRCIAAGTSEKGCCPKCGKPWVRVVESDTHKAKERDMVDRGDDERGRKVRCGDTETQTLGWQPGCECLNEAGRYVSTPKPIPCIVLDPFAGIGTTLAVAARMKRRSIGIELNQEYIDMGLPDCEAAFKGITVKEVEAGQEVLFNE